MMLTGHDEAWKEWRAALASSRLHHGWIFSGIKGIGKGAFARAAARELVSEPGIAQPQGDHHPDILILDHLPANDDEEKKRDEGKPFQTKRNISVDQIRRMQRRLTTRPTLGTRRAVIIDPADDLETAASNALLKSLEEPPAGTFFLLIAHRPGRLLATIRSRCRSLHFAPLDALQLEQLVRRESPEASQEAQAAAIEAAGGSPGAALDFIARDLAPLAAAMHRIATDGDPDLVFRSALADAFGPKADRERISATFDLARNALARALAGAPHEQQARIIEAHAALARLGAQAPTYNFDTGLLVLEIGHLLASAAASREAAA